MCLNLAVLVVIEKITSDVCAKQNNPELAHLCLTPSTFGNSRFCVRPAHTKKSHPAGLIRKFLEPRVPSPASAPMHPGLKENKDDFYYWSKQKQNLRNI
jgi:hypothetical protein